MHKYLLLAMTIFVSLNSCNSNTNKNKTEIKEVDIKEITDNSNIYLIIGTYTSNGSDGIYVYQLDTISGNSKFISSTNVINPSYLVISDNEKFIYAVTETGDKSAAVNAFSFDKQQGKLNFLNSEPTNGADPCYITIDKDGKHVLTANYSGGSISMFNVDSVGKLLPVSDVIEYKGKGKDDKRQSKPHLHCVIFSPDQKYLYATDLGTDKIYKMIVDKDSQQYLTPGNSPFTKLNDMSGPRHLVFHPTLNYLYLINELSGSVNTFEYNPDNGNLNIIQSIQSDTVNAKGSADIHITPNGKYLYSSNRLENDGLAIFSIKSDGNLEKVGYQNTGKHPRNFIITPNGKYLLVACKDDDIIQIFKIDDQTGLLNDIDKNIQIKMPVCLKFISINQKE